MAVSALADLYEEINRVLDEVVLILDERDAARRWASCWKTAAKKYCSEFRQMFDSYQGLGAEMHEATMRLAKMLPRIPGPPYGEDFEQLVVAEIDRLRHERDEAIQRAEKSEAALERALATQQESVDVAGSQGVCSYSFVAVKRRWVPEWLFWLSTAYVPTIKWRQIVMCPPFRWLLTKPTSSRGR